MTLPLTTPLRRLAATTALAVVAGVPVGVAFAPVAAHADTPGSYANASPVSWDATTTSPAPTTISVADPVSQLSSVSVTVDNLMTSDVTGLHALLTSPDGTTVQLLQDPATIGGSTTADGTNVTFNSDGSGESSYESLGNVLTHQGNGDWTLALSDDNGATGSIQGWSLDMTAAPIVSTQPQDQTVDSGTNATFTVVGDGMPEPTVQWQSSTDGGSTWTDIPNATDTTLTVTAPTLAQDSTAYQAVFTNSLGTATSWTASLYVNPTGPNVTTQPVPVSVEAGSDASFTAHASGDPAITGVQWQSSDDGGSTWNSIDGATSDTYTVNAVTLADNGIQYEAVFSSDNGDATTDPATLTVTGALPGVPTAVHAAQTALGKVTVSWTAPANAGTPATLTGFSVGYARGQSGNGYEVAPTQTASTITGLSPGTYLVSVAASNAAGDSPRVFLNVTVTAPTSTPTIAASTPRVTDGQRFTLTGSGPASAHVVIQQSVAGSPWTTLATVSTGQFGAYSLSVKPAHNAVYRTVYGKRISPTVSVLVRTAVSFTSSRVGVRTYTFSGTAYPVAPGQLVKLSAKLGSTVVSMGTAKVGSTGHWALRFTFPKAGSWTVVAAAQATSRNIPNAAIVTTPVV